MASAGVRLPQDFPRPNIPPGGLVTRPPYQPPSNITSPTNSLTNQYNLYNSGVEQNAEDYSDIMNKYRELYKQGSNVQQPTRFQPINYSPIGAPTQLSPSTSNYTPERMNYTPGAAPTDVTVTGRTYTPDAELVGALGKFRQLSETGGYSDADINALRARGVSPIRSVYANAQRNIDRSRALRGGMGSNYNAVNAKMARELADTVGEQTNRVNAGIAEQVAAGKLSGTQGYGNLASGIDAARAAAESENMAAKNRIAEFNADSMNRYNEANAGRRFDTERLNTEASNTANLRNAQNRADVERYNTEGRNRANEMNWNAANDLNKFNTQGANETARWNAQFGQQQFGNQQNILDAMRSLYGTTPALANLFGSQASNYWDQQQRANAQNDPMRFMSAFR